MSPKYFTFSSLLKLKLLEEFLHIAADFCGRVAMGRSRTKCAKSIMRTSRPLSTTNTSRRCLALNWILSWTKWWTAPNIWRIFLCSKSWFLTFIHWIICDFLIWKNWFSKNLKNQNFRILEEFGMELVYKYSFPEAVKYYMDRDEREAKALMGRMKALEAFPPPPNTELTGKDGEYDHAAEKLKSLKVENPNQRIVSVWPTGFKSFFHSSFGITFVDN